MRRPLFRSHLVSQRLTNSDLSFNLVAVVVVEGQSPVDIGESELRIMSDDFRGCLAAKVVPDMNVPDTDPSTSHAGLAPADGRLALDMLGDDWLVLLNVHTSMTSSLGGERQPESTGGTRALWPTATGMAAGDTALS